MSFALPNTDAFTSNDLDTLTISDNVNHPKHYKSESGLETIDVIEAFTSDLKGVQATDTGNVIKYICRWKKKNGLQDLKKAMWYLQHLIDHVELASENHSFEKMDDYSIVSLETEEDLEEASRVLRIVPCSKLIKYRKGIALYIPNENKENGGN